MDLFDINSYDYHLPTELIAKFPCESRSDSRLLCIDRTAPLETTFSHQHFYDLPTFLRPGDLLVLNNTRVVPARLYGQKLSGGKIEALVERPLPNNQVLMHIRSSKPIKEGTHLIFLNQQADDSFTAKVVGRQENLYQVQLPPEHELFALLSEFGEIPLPPYLERKAESLDSERYQTVYAEASGAVAAPTAGLHFDDALFKRLKQSGVDHAFLTLHVGAGTFQPVRVDNIKTHKMHSEWMEVTQATCDKLKATKQAGGRIIAVGTTSVRALETLGKLQDPFSATTLDTDIFIYPGFEFHLIDGMITNFHLPKSTLLMLVAAFAGYEKMMAAYKIAVENQYRFYSYGDAMLIL